jgi:hypothetical protein
MQYKGFTFPHDGWLIITVLAKVLYYSYQCDQKSPQDLMALVKIKARKMKSVGDSEALVRLGKMRRAANFFLLRIAKSRRPCLIRSCILLEQALGNKLNAELIIGVKYQNEGLTGHSWITIDNQPFQEALTELMDYTIMMKS